MADLNVGSFGKKSNIDLKKLQAGMKAEQLQTKEEKSIFNKVDKDGNGVIDADELKAFSEGLDKSNDGKVSRKEARKFIKKNGLKGEVKKKDVLKFLNANIKNTENIENTKIILEKKKEKEEKHVQITYKDGHQEVINSDKSSQLIQSDGEGRTTTKFLDKNKKLLKDKVEIKAGDKIQSTVEISYAEDGKTPINKVENEGTAKEKRTEYTYSEDGTTTEKISEPGINKTTTRVRKGDVTLTEHINDNGRIADREYDEKGYTEKTTDDNGNPTTNFCNLYNKKLVQEKTVGDQKYQATYDGQGNTTGIIVQNRESLSDLANKFGCSEEALKELNGKESFAVGDEIKVPGEIEADSPALQNRKDAQGAKQDALIQQQRDARAAAIREQRAAAAAVRKARAAAQEAQYRQMGLKNHKGRGTKVTGHYKSGKKETFTVIGEAGNGRKLVKGKNGKISTVAHDGTVLKESYVQNTNLYASGKKVKGKIKGKDGKLHSTTFAEVPNAKLPHGRKAVVDAKGRTWIMAQNGTILDNKYVAKSNYADQIKANKGTAQKVTVNMMSNQLDQAQAAFDKQMNADGWAEDVADGISVLWGSNNRASKVREDLKTYRNNINQLKNAAKQGDAQFKTKFKQIYGVNYNQNAIANYYLRPTKANYQKAFGTKNDIGYRVAKYNESQKAGGEWVKTGAKVAAGIAAVATAIPSGGSSIAAYAAGLGAAGVATAAADIAIDVSNKAVSKEGLQDGELGQYVKDGVIDGTITVATLGTSKIVKGGYTAYKAAKATSKAATAAEKAAEQSAVNVEKGLTTTAQQGATGVETGLATQTTGTAERGVARLGQQGSNITERGLTKAGKNTEKGLTRTGQQGSNTAEKGLTKAGENSEKGLARTGQQGSNVAERGLAKAGENAEKGLAKIEPQAGNTVSDTAAKVANGALSKTEEAVIDTAVDAAVGAGAEYMQTGQVTVEGTAMNMAIGAGGLLGEKLSTKLKGSNLYQKASDKVSNAYNNVKDKFASKGTAATPETGLARTEKLNTSNSSTRAEKTADNAFEQKTARKADSTESRRRAEEAKKTEQAKKAEEAKKAEQAKKTEEAKKAEQAKKAEEAKKTQAQSAEKIQNRMETLNAEIKEGELAKDFKEKYADIFDSNYNIDLNDPKAEAALRSKIRPMILAVHGDRGQGISKDFQQAVAKVFDNLKKKNATGVKSSLAQLNNVLDNRVSTLTRKRAELNNLKAQFGDLNAKKATAENKAEQPKAAKEADKVQNESKVNNEKAQQKTKDSFEGYTDKVYIATDNFKAGDAIPKGQEIFLNGNERFRVGLGQSQVDFSSPEIQARLRKMKNGETLTIGRQGDIIIAANDMTVSRKHFTITRDGDSFIIKDISTNGSFMGSAKSANPTYNNKKLNKYKIDKNKPVKDHVSFYRDNKKLFKGTESWNGTCWQGFEPKDQHHGAWKMHMYSIDEHDWQQMSEAIIPYLKDHGIEWKTLNAGYGADYLNGSVQQGKAFTIYPRDNAHMEQVAKDLDYIIRNNNLNINGSDIIGDRAMGDSGRLFYRYEYNTGAVKDINLDLNDAYDRLRYHNLYDANHERIERNGKGSYLADDMSAADDPWLNFDPSDLDSHPTP
ncbi:MAG: FHA domain-containing protein [Candidatus Gastranaerophilaceae bacterium]